MNSLAHQVKMAARKDRRGTRKSDVRVLLTSQKPAFPAMKAKKNPVTGLLFRTGYSRDRIAFVSKYSCKSTGTKRGRAA